MTESRTVQPYRGDLTIEIVVPVHMAAHDAFDLISKKRLLGDVEPELASWLGRWGARVNDVIEWESRD